MDGQDADERTATPLVALEAMDHARNMRLAIAEGVGNAVWPFGAVIVDAASGAVVARGVNGAHLNPILHGEVVALNDYVARRGPDGLASTVLYTTAEPCPMCMGALIWAGVGAVVYGASIERLAELGVPQIRLSAAEVCARADFSRVRLLGGVLSEETDALFANRVRQE